MKLDILIPTYNRCKPLIKNLESLKTILNQLGAIPYRENEVMDLVCDTTKLSDILD